MSSCLQAIAALLLAILPIDLASVQTVDQCERNFFYDENGCHVFTQLIFSDWHPHCGEFRIVDWRMVKEQYTHPRGRIVMMDGERLRDIRCRSYVESWTQFDPELTEREVWPKEWRRGLR